MAGPIRISILADGRRARGELDQTSRRFEGFGRTVARAGKVAAIGFGAGIAAAALAAKEFAEGAAEDETAAKLLEGALRRNASATDEQVAAVERWIEAQGKLLGVTDDELRPALGSLVTATKDIGQAQDLASTAMDVAAARGKTLKQVSEALMKAQNGQVSGLARLGVNTKDAAGETITFEQALQRMQDQFGGAAQEKAKTLQGQINRIRVLAAETGEAIGYKLLPPLADLATDAAEGGRALAKVADDKLGPKIDQLTGYFSENKDEIFDLAKTASGDLLPVLEELFEMATDLGGALGDTALPVAQDLVPALGDLASVVGDVLGFVNDLPGPVKEFGIEAGIAALVLPRLAAGVALTGTAMRDGATYARVLNLELRDQNTRAQLAQGAVQRLGGAARQAAGIGGLALLAQGASDSNKKMQALGNIGGGALLGFSVAGPVGAAVGGTGGLLVTMAQSADRANDALKRSERPALDYASSLNEISGAATQATRELVLLGLKQDDLLDVGARLGLSSRDLVDYILGQEGATKRVDKALREASSATQDFTLNTATGQVTMDGMLQTAWDLESGLKGLSGELNEQVQGVRNDALAVQDLGKVFKGLPKQAITRIQAVGAPETARQIANLAKRFNMTPKQIRTVIKATGVDATAEDVQRISGRLRDLDQTKVTLKGVSGGVDKAVSGAEKAANLGGGRIARSLEEKTARARPNLSPFQRAIAPALSPAQSSASAGGLQVGNALESGVITGFASTQQRLSTAAAAAVGAAIAAAKARARVNSPSKETDYIGQMMGVGLVQGLKRLHRRAHAGGRNIVRELLAGVTNGSEGVDASLTRLDGLIEKTFDASLDKQKKNIREGLREREKELRQKLKGKALDKAIDGAKRNAERDERDAEKINTKARRKAIKDLRDQRAAIIANGKAQDAVNESLANAESALQAAKDAALAYSDAVKQGFVEYGSISSLGAGDGFGSADQLVAQLRTRVQQAERYAEMIRQLRAAGLNDTTLQQLVDAGVQGGYGTAQTLLSGGAGVIREFNDLTSQLAAAGGSLGDELAQHFHGAGIQAAQGLVDGLRAQQAQLDAAAEQMAEALAQAVKRKLKIKSPSRVFMGIGDNVTKGLAIGLDDVYVAKRGAVLAGSLEKGFGSPALRAYQDAAATASAAATPVTPPQIVIQVAPTADKVAIGKELQGALDAYYGAGGRRSA